MEIKQLQLVRRIPKEQYGYEEITALIDIESDEDPAEALEEARVKLGISGSEGAEESEEEQEEEEEDPKKGSKKSSKKKEEEEDESEEEENEESDEGESEEDAEADEADEAEEGSEEEEEEKPKRGAKKDAKAGKKFRQLGSPYDRNNDTHKNILSKFLKSSHPKWAAKDPAARKRGQEVSKEMHGEEFLDGEGHLKESFTKKYLELMKAKPKKK